MIRVSATFAVLLAAAGLSHAANYFPLAQGNSWVYREAKTGAQFAVEVGAPVSVAGNIYYTLKGYVDQPVLVRMSGLNLVYRNQDAGRDDVLTPFEQFDGGWWLAPVRNCTDDSQAHEKFGAHQGPAGTFPEVLEVQYRSFSCADAGLLLEQFAGNVGMVRRTMQSFAGPRTFDLVHARVDRTTIDALPSGRFTVSPAFADSGLVNVTLSLDIAPSIPVVLHFASGQEYQIVVRDSSGRAIYTWGLGIFFTQNLHDVTVTDHWSATVDIPRPPDGEYTLEAWLTTIDNTPRIGSVVPLVIGTPKAF